MLFTGELLSRVTDIDSAVRLAVVKGVCDLVCGVDGSDVSSASSAVRAAQGLAAVPAQLIHEVVCRVMDRKVRERLHCGCLIALCAVLKAVTMSQGCACLLTEHGSS